MLHQAFPSPPELREAMRSLAWKWDLRKSSIRFLEILEALMVGGQYDDQLRVHVNNQRSAADFHNNMADLKTDLSDVQEMFDQEVEASKPPAPTPPPAVSPTQAQDGNLVPKL